MNEWTVVTAISVLIGLFLSIGAPVIKLNSNIVKLNANMEAQRERTDRQEHELEEQKKEARESHKALWLHNTEQDKLIADHEHRITVLEREA